MQWTGVVLAGGKSSRMGRDKAQLLWQGTPLLQHMCALLLASGASRVMVSGNYPEMGGIADTSPELGPLGGLASVAPHIPDGALLLVPVDMPQLTPSLLLHLVQHAHANAACYQAHMLPMWLHLNQHLRSWLKAAIHLPAKARSLHALHAAMGGVFLPAPEGTTTELTNLNTPDQWLEASV